MKNIYLILLCCVLSSCTPYPSETIKPIQNPSHIQQNKIPFIGLPTPDNYSICHGHTCNDFATINLTAKQWQSVESLFYPPANDAVQEREQIKYAIALLEMYSGEQAGTYNDQAKNEIVQSTKGQLDCIDEATNTTVYLRLLSDNKLLQFHQQASRTHRGGLFAPHNTATIIDIDSNIRYAVDSWFYANGEQPVIIPLPQWKDGWKPEE